MRCVTSVVLVVAVLGLVVFGCGPGVREIQGEDYVGVIVEHPCTEQGLVSVPTPGDVANFERKLPALIVSNERLAETPLRTTLPLYRRRYAGERVGPSRIMCITFIHEESRAVRSGRWRTAEAYGIVGGGYRVWSMKYDVGRGDVIEVEFQPGE